MPESGKRLTQAAKQSIGDRQMFEVEKFIRGGDGKWFGCGAKRFKTETEARTYFAAFAAEQKEVLSNGIRIDLRIRKGRKTIATVGGQLENATEIREFAQ